METSRLPLRAILLGSLTLALRAPGWQQTTLIGFWESENRTQGGIGNGLEFREDGTFTQTFAAMVDYVYHLEGNQLTVGGKPVDVSIQRDVFVVKGPDGKDQLRKERVGAALPDAPTIVGTWTYWHYTQVPAFERYTRDGRMSLRVPMRSVRGRYKISGDSLTVQVEGGSPSHLVMSIQGDELLLSQGGNETLRYLRVTEGAWYPQRTPEDPRLHDLASLPAGLAVVHTPNPVKAQEGGRSGHRYTWVYKTTVRALSEPVKIEGFGAFDWREGRWVFANFTGKPFGAHEFGEWYSCPNAAVSPDQDYSDPTNWTGRDTLQPGKVNWYFIGVDAHGRRVKGEAVIEQMGELKR